jgi:ribosomal-protein-alanine N-acetyltransferase
MAELVISSMTGDDIASVRSLDANCFPDPWSQATWERELGSEGRNHLVAWLGDQLVGHASSLLMVDELHITVVAVNPAVEGRGVATLLCLELLRAGQAAGAAASTLEVRVNSLRAQRMYRRLGFAPAGVRPAYYRDPVEDALIMWLHDLDSEGAKERLREVAADVAVSERVA